MHKNLFLWTLLVIVIMGCDPKKLYESDLSFVEKNWDMNETPVFSFELQEAETVDIYFKIRNDLDYPYQNLYIQYTLRTDKGSELRKNLVNLSLFDAKTGVPLGKGGSIFQHRSVLIASEMLAAGTYEIELAQYMRNKALTGIYSVGVRIEETDLTEN